MKHKLSLISFLLFSSLFCLAQQSNKTYAITGQAQGNFNWTDIREIDMNTGGITKVLFENEKVKSGQAKIAMITPQNHAANVTNIAGTGIAACAYDKRTNRLYFTPMLSGDLSYYDLNSNTPKFVVNQNSLLAKPENGFLTEESHITRMTMGADGNGYAITNDGNHLIRFTTGKKTVISDLGNLVDAQSNNSVSVHNKCTSWGGDIVSDAYGKLYLFTATHNVFTIDINSRVATYTGTVKNLTGTFTVNGAAVENDENVILSSANTFEGFYKVNVKDLNATKLETNGQIFNASDLANGNLLYETEARKSLGTATLIEREVIGNQFLSVYPNPVIGSQFKVTFDNTKAGRYNIELTDVQGRLISNKLVNIKYAKQVEQIQLKLKPASGMYMIKVTDEKKKSIFSDKLVFD